MSAFDIWIRSMGKSILMLVPVVGLGIAVVYSPIWLLPYIIVGAAIVWWGWYSYGVAKIKAKHAEDQEKHDREIAELRKRPRRTVF